VKLEYIGKTLQKAHLIRNTLIAATAMMTLPLLASASAPTSTPNIKVAYHPAELQSTWGRNNIYQTIQDASSKICESSNIQIAGSLNRSLANEERRSCRSHHVFAWLSVGSSQSQSDGARPNGGTTCAPGNRYWVGTCSSGSRAV